MEIIVTSDRDVVRGLMMSSLSIRFGVIFTTGANVLSPLHDWIGFRKQVETGNPPMRFIIDKLLADEATEEGKAALNNIWATYRILQAKQRKSGPDIVFMKKTEQLLRTEFRNWGMNLFDILVKPGGFDAFEDMSHEDGLYKQFIHLDLPEDAKENYHKLSQYLRFDFDHGPNGPCIFVIDNIGIDHLMAQGANTFHLMDLPNLNMLNYEGLMACRTRMRPVAEALDPVARQWWDKCTAPDGCQREALEAEMATDVKRLHDILSPVVSADPDLQWAASIMPDANWCLSIWFALCPYSLFIDCMDRNGVILPPTAQALAALKDVSGPPSFVPVIVISQGNDASQEGKAPNESGNHDESETPTKKLRTLDID